MKTFSRLSFLPALSVVISFAIPSLSFAHPSLNNSTQDKQAHPGTVYESPGDALDISPFWDWKTINTEHFRITFPVELSAQAQRVAQYYEEAQRVMGPEMHWTPNHKVQVLLADQTDSANGLTLANLRFGMLLFLTPPESWFSTTYYEDWLKLLVFHEYTHYLNMDTTRGFFTVLRYIFGDVFLPNSLWPTWMLEGLAVYNETKYTRVGRGRSPYFEMITRTAVDKKLLDDSAYITLDEINGEHPAPPSGEVPYFFGYQLMNQVEKTKEHSVGEMSRRSGGRIPYFINGNLDNITGKDWYDYWKEWVAMSNQKAGRDLELIRKSPVTKLNILTPDAYEALGTAISLDETFLAYSSEEKTKWSSLYLKNLKTGATDRIEDKFLGVGMSFHPSAPILLYSSLRRSGQYYFYSDLKAYDRRRNTSYFISEDLRAKDPDISRDGKFVTYAVAEKSSNALGIAELKWTQGEMKLENPKVVFTPTMLDRVANPKFSPDGKWVVFSFKKNGAVGEELRRLDVRTGKVEILLSDKFMNRFPAFHPNGTLYFVSDRNGVDNIYRMEGMTTLGKGLTLPRPVAVTNTTTGLWLPTLSRTKTIASVYEPTGWKLAEVELKDTILQAISSAEGPKPELSEATTAEYPIEDYSAWSTLLPRQWSPYLFNSKYSTDIGAEILGYDAVLRHAYFFYGSYDTQLKLGDFLGTYQNRSFGPTLGLSASQVTKDLNQYASGPTYTRKYDVQGSLGYTFKWDVARLTPRVAASIERESAYSYYNGNRQFIENSQFVPTQEATLDFANTRYSSWAVAPETGRHLSIGAKRYNDSEIDNYKGVAKWTEYFHLGNNWVLSPSVKGVATSKRNNRFTDANGVVSGKESGVFNPFGVDDFEKYYIRGYSDRAFIVNRAATGSMDLRFPVSQIFRGWGTNPIFLDQLVMNVFGESSYCPEKPAALKWLPSAGAGLKLNTEVLLHLPISFGLDYQYGFNKTRRSSDHGELFFSIGFSNVLPVDL